MYISDSTNIIKDLSFNFAVRIVKFNQYLVNEKKEFVLSKQIIGSLVKIIKSCKSNV